MAARHHGLGSIVSAMVGEKTRARVPGSSTTRGSILSIPVPSATLRYTPATSIAPM
jgi:hypothetical protein